MWRVKRWFLWISALAFSSKVFFYFSIYALCCLPRMQEVSVYGPSFIVNVANSLKRSALPGSYCMSRWCSVFLEPLLSQWWHFSITSQCWVVQNLSRAKMSKSKWKYGTGLLPAGVGAVLVTVSKAKMLFLFVYPLISTSWIILYYNKKYRHSRKRRVSEYPTRFLWLPPEPLYLTEHNLPFPRDSFLLVEK